MLLDQRLDLTDELSVPAECELGVDEILERDQAVEGERRQLELGEELELPSLERPPAPEPERRAQLLGALGVVARRSRFNKGRSPSGAMSGNAPRAPVLLVGGAIVPVVWAAAVAAKAPAVIALRITTIEPARPRLTFSPRVRAPPLRQVVTRQGGAQRPDRRRVPRRRGRPDDHADERAACGEAREVHP